ncbi:MAG TPA: glucose/galactose MFS transporter, partial [Puia sp.]|nr:glucose/galactose MFS transporter [Puia sp.]
VLFFVFGFVTWLGSVLIPYLHIACQLNTFSSYLVAFSFYISYAVMAVPAAAVLRRTGYKKGMALGLLIMSAGAVIFIPAALTRSYLLFLSGLFIQGTGLAVLQTAANPYVTILGPLDSAARRISIMGVCNGIAGVMAPLIIGSVALKDADTIRDRVAHLPAAQKTSLLDMLAHRVIWPYTIIAVVIVLLACWVFLSGLPELDTDPTTEMPDDGGAANPVAASKPSTTNPVSASKPVTATKTSIFQFPHLLLGVLTLFLYVGVEVIAVDTIINYGASQGIRLSTAKNFSSFTLSGMLIGYLLGILLIPKYLSQTLALKISAGLGLVFVFAALSTSGLVSVIFIAFLGLANSLCWPSIWPLAINGLGKFTAIGSSLLIVAIGGGALLPLLYGWLAELSTPQHAYWVVVPSYLSIAWYAMTGHKAGIPRAN